ncbi:unnamed protein product, partial [Sphacelaria rigidula]
MLHPTAAENDLDNVQCRQYIACTAAFSSTVGWKCSFASSTTAALNMMWATFSTDRTKQYNTACSACRIRQYTCAHVRLETVMYNGCTKSDVEECSTDSTRQYRTNVCTAAYGIRQYRLNTSVCTQCELSQ